MPTRNAFLLRFIVTAATIASCGMAGSAPAQTLIDEWTSVQVPLPPALKSVAIDTKTTALPADGEPIFSSGVDKFVNTDLEKFLKDKGITTVVVVRNAAHGAVLYTASGAAMREFKVIIPVDGVSSDTAYSEQYVAWHLANAPVISSAMTLTKIADVKF